MYTYCTNYSKSDMIGIIGKDWGFLRKKITWYILIPILGHLILLYFNSSCCILQKKRSTCITWNTGFFFSMMLKLEVWFCYCSMSLSVKNLRPTSPQIFVAHTFLIPIKVEHNLINKAICLTHVVYKEFNKCMYRK